MILLIITQEELLNFAYILFIYYATILSPYLPTLTYFTYFFQISNMVINNIIQGSKEYNIMKIHNIINVRWKKNNINKI